MTTLLNTLFSEKGGLFTIGQGRCVLFALVNRRLTFTRKNTGLR